MTLGKSPDSVRRCGMMSVSRGDLSLAGLAGDSSGGASAPSSCGHENLSTANPSRALARSAASVSAFGGSSRICSQPTGGDPGGEIRKFLSVSGTGRYSGKRLRPSDSSGVGFAL